jgi:hypothetical protein
MSKKLKIIFLVVVVFTILFFVSRSLKGNKEVVNSAGIASEGGGVSVGVNPNEVASGFSPEQLSTFSSLLQTLQAIQIDTTLFSSQKFKNLKDNSVDLGDIMVQRVNPFARIGQDVGGVRLSQLNSQSLTIETVQPDPKSITKTSAEFSAFVEFQGALPVDVLFQYGVGEITNITPPFRVTSSGFVKATVTNLEPGKTYTVSSVGTRGSNKQVGSSMTFTTQP